MYFVNVGNNLTLQDWGVRYWLARGTPAHKIMLGVAAYGRTFTLKSTAHYGLGAAVRGSGKPGDFTSERGFLAYYEVRFVVCKHRV